MQHGHEPSRCRVTPPLPVEGDLCWILLSVLADREKSNRKTGESPSGAVFGAPNGVASFARWLPGLPNFGLGPSRMWTWGACKQRVDAVGLT